MAIAAFPPVSSADDDGLLAMGGDLEIPSLLLAYTQGIFPWPLDKKTLAWFAPPERAILELRSLHINRSLKRAIRDDLFTVEYNTDFHGVISRCASAKNRKGQRGTWITPAMVSAYTALHESHFAQCIACYKDQELVGGIYGVSIGGFFAAESMFYSAPNASKVALYALVSSLATHGYSWIDLQVINPFTESMGAITITRDEFSERLSVALTQPQYWLSQ
jgi:leucyl/phenylalanyl-tRNA--protein transferase